MAATDHRELIAARLLAIAAGLVGATRAARNVPTITAKTSPAIVIWDGDEDAQTDHGEGMAQAIELRPEIRILLEAPATSIGTTLNGLRLQLIAAIVGDATLLAACGGSGRGRARIVYQGCSHAIEAGRKVEGEISLNFSFRYTLLTSDLS